MISFITSLGQSFGVGIGGVLFQNQWNKYLHHELAAGNVLPKYSISYRQAEQTGELIKAFPEPVKIIYRVIMANVIDDLFILLASLSGLAFVVSLLSRNLSMDRETRSSQQFKEKSKTQSKVEEDRIGSGA